jgi:large subunit ribosomal protein L49
MYPQTDTPRPSPVSTVPQYKAGSANVPIDHGNLSPTLCSLPYNILRTPSKNLPIYQSTKSGGSKHITTIRKIQGDLTELATAVRRALGMEEYMTDMRGRRKANIVINRTTQHIVVRGWRGPEIKRWAEMSGF